MQTALSLTCVLLGLAVTPVLAQENTVANSAKTIQTQATKTVAPERAPIHMAPISVLPASLKRNATATCAAPAQSGPALTYGFTLGAFVPTSLPDKVGSSLGISASVERTVFIHGYGSIVVSVRYSYYSINTPVTDGDINLISPIVGYRFFFGPGKHFYGEAGVGIVFLSGKLGGLFGSSQTDFAYNFAGGYEFPNHLYADIRYMAGGNELEQGVTLSLGGHF